MTRLIDADALDEAMYHKSFETDDGRQKWHSGLWIRYKIYEEASREAPTVDAEPVRHGRWIGYPECLGYENALDDSYIVCSVCKEPFNIIDNDTERFDYCPHCGANMDL